jgi:hypothetical protein
VQLRVNLEPALFSLTASFNYAGYQWPLFSKSIFGNTTETSPSGSEHLGLWKYCAFLNINPRGLFLSTLLGISAALFILPLTAAVAVLIAVLINTHSRKFRVLSTISIADIRYISGGVAVRLLKLTIYPLISAACFQLSFVSNANGAATSAIDIGMSYLAAVAISLQAWVCGLLIYSVAKNRTKETPLTRYTHGRTFFRTSKTDIFQICCFVGHLVRKYRPKFWYMFAVNLVANGLSGVLVGLVVDGLIQVIGISVLNVSVECSPTCKLDERVGL